MRLTEPTDTMTDETYYTVLGVSETATKAEIKAAYRGLLKKIHPDTVSSLSPGVQRLSEEATEELITAYSVLSDASRRRDYDQHLALQRTEFSPVRTTLEQRLPVYPRPHRYHRCGWPLDAEGRCPKCDRSRSRRKEHTHTHRRHRLRRAWRSLRDWRVILGYVLLAAIVGILLGFISTWLKGRLFSQ